MKPGKVLTVKQAREAAKAGRPVWAEMINYAPDDEDYLGPAIFEEGGDCYYLNPIDESVAASAMEIGGEVIPVSFSLTDIDFDEFGGDDDLMYTEWDEGTLQMMELLDE